VVAALDGRGIRLREALVASEMVAQTLERPLVNAGWGGLLVLVFLVLVLASASGVMLFSYLDTRERQTEFALMRTLGSSRAQLTGVVWFSVILVVAGGIGLGSWAGQWIGASLLPLMEVAEEGARVTPPMVLQTDWSTLLVSYLVLAGVTAATVAWLAWITFRMEVQQVLRIGEG
jgi:putative ABC transport system permease protein